MVRNQGLKNIEETGMTLAWVLPAEGKGRKQLETPGNKATKVRHKINFGRKLLVRPGCPEPK